MGWVKLVLGVGVAAYSYRSVTHVNSLVRQVSVPKYSLLAKHTQAGMGTDRLQLTLEFAPSVHCAHFINFPMSRIKPYLRWVLPWMLTCFYFS